VKTFTTRQGITSRNPIGSLIDALRLCERAVVSEARAQMLPREREARAAMAAELFKGCARHFGCAN
jgi:hypothetical protein